MNLKTVAIFVIIIVLIIGVLVYFVDQNKMREGSTNYIKKSIKAVEKVEALNKEKADTISEQERDIESW